MLRKTANKHVISKEARLIPIPITIGIGILMDMIYISRFLAQARNDLTILRGHLFEIKA